MATQSNARPIIKRKKIVKADGHHGGAWKVAYADFVTAMMAFFMLMWLLGATTEKQRKGIADYFNPTVPINRISGGGEGSFGGDSVFSEDTMAQSGTGAGLSRPTKELRARGSLGLESGEENAGEEDAGFRQVESALHGLSGESLLKDFLRRHIVTHLSDRGLVIELFEREDALLFEPETGEPTNVLRRMLPLITNALNLVVNDVAVEAHVPGSRDAFRDKRSWSLSTERADRVRRALETAGLERSRIRRVTGFGDRQPVTADPMATRNSRVELVVLRNVERG